MSVGILSIVLNVVLLVLYITVDSTRETGSVSRQVGIVGLYLLRCFECCRVMSSKNCIFVLLFFCYLGDCIGVGWLRSPPVVYLIPFLVY